jgi:hypothetical protein
MAFTASAPGSEESANPASAASGLESILRAGRERLGEEAAAEILQGADELTSLKPGTRMTLRQAVAEEALILLNDRRPSLLFAGGRLEHRSSLAEHWPALVDDDLLARLEAVAASVALVRLGDRKIGTGLLVGKRLLMTNQHVLDDLGADAIAARRATVEFGDGNDDATRLTVARAIPSGLWETPSTIDPNRQLDIAFLELAEDLQAPAVLAIDTRDHLADGEQPIAAIGFPINRPDSLSDRVIAAIFGEAVFGRKRLAPGVITVPPFGGLPPHLAPQGDRRGWVFLHDAATTGGSSGSCIVSMAEDEACLFGIHFAGQTEVANLAHRLGNPDVRCMLADQSLVWR